jgi:uridine phosphorylase
MMKENQQPITGCGTGDTAPCVFLCGDPERVPRISADWEDVEEVCRVREYLVHTGTFKGVRLTAASTGIGGPSTAVVFEELAKLGGRVFIRIGNSGALADEVGLGDYVITTGAVRDEGTSRSYVTPAYPAAADYEVVRALVAAAQASGRTFHAGTTWSVDGFYARNKVLGEGGALVSMSHEGYEQSWMGDLMNDMKKARVLNIEMESSTILTLASLFGLKAGCICTVSDRTPWPGPGQDMISLNKNIHGAIGIATEAMLALAAQAGLCSA